VTRECHTCEDPANPAMCPITNYTSGTAHVMAKLVEAEARLVEAQSQVLCVADLEGVCACLFVRVARPASVCARV
jgi:hypothetical protein